ncbi:MAG TPA: hypothetical protein VHW23_24120 [Kofleriaceae bacterium]|jgi:hypothetical protein|nr:hypothetical protein [Kofleriaceae bacterium]
MQIRSIAPSTGPSLAALFAALFVLSRWALAAAVSAAVVGCYTPVLPPGEPCATTEGCPTEQRCVAGLCTEAATLPSDAGAPEGSGGTTPGGSAGDAGPTASCQGTDACLTAITLGTISGDTGNQTLTAKGSRAAWFRVRVTENDTDLDGVAMHVLARLTPPAGADFDVRVYVNPDTDILECTNTSGVATTSGNVKQVRASWGEDVVTDGEDDSRDVSIEVRPLSGSCSSTATWQLVIEGDWN